VPIEAISIKLLRSQSIHSKPLTPSLLVPADALIFNSGGLQVAVVENGVAHMRKISVSRDLGTEIEVRDGVNPGDQVVLNPPINLIDGSRVVARSDDKADVKKTASSS